MFGYTLIPLLYSRSKLGRRGNIFTVFFVCVLGAMESKEEAHKSQIAFIATKKVVINDK